MAAPDATGIAGTPGQGRFIVLYLRVLHGRIAEASFECNGCGVTIACGSALTELVVGRTTAECRQITSADLFEALDGIPVDKVDRASFAIDALVEAIRHVNV